LRAWMVSYTLDFPLADCLTRPMDKSLTLDVRASMQRRILAISPHDSAAAVSMWCHRIKSIHNRTPRSAANRGQCHPMRFREWVHARSGATGLVWHPIQNISTVLYSERNVMSGSREWTEKHEADDDKRITIKDDSIPLASVEPAKEKDGVVADDGWEDDEGDRESERDIAPEPEPTGPQPPSPPQGERGRLLARLAAERPHLIPLIRKNESQRTGRTSGI
jgi:hypothetical protein